MKNLLTIVLIAAMSIGANVQAAKAGTSTPNPHFPKAEKTPYAKVIKHECKHTLHESTCITTYDNGVKITIKSKRK
jgi:hypothetical protein